MIGLTLYRWYFFKAFGSSVASNFGTRTLSGRILTWWTMMMRIGDEMPEWYPNALRGFLLKQLFLNNFPSSRVRSRFYNMYGDTHRSNRPTIISTFINTRISSCYWWFLKKLTRFWKICYFFEIIRFLMSQDWFSSRHRDLYRINKYEQSFHFMILLSLGFLENKYISRKFVDFLTIERHSSAPWLVMQSHVVPMRGLILFSFLAYFFSRILA